MNDLGHTILTRYGGHAIVAAIAMAICVWGFAHSTAAPGTEVSVLWGLVRYTKSDSPEFPSSRTRLPRADSAITSIDQQIITAGISITNAVDLAIVTGVADTNYAEVVTALRKERRLREMTAYESSKSLGDIPAGCYGFLFAGGMGRWSIKTYPIDRYNFGLPWIEVHFLHSGAELLVFTTEKEAGTIASLPGNTEHHISVVARPVGDMRTLVLLPISRVIAAEEREMQFSVDYVTLALEMTVK